ncbi:hypothetical protein D3C72_1961770 [compost metagenome]
MTLASENVAGGEERAGVATQNISATADNSFFMNQIIGLRIAQYNCPYSFAYGVDIQYGTLISKTPTLLSALCKWRVITTYA